MTDTTAKADSVVPVEKLVRVYIKMDDRLTELRRAYEEQEAKLKEQMTTVKHALADYLKETGTESARTAAGLFYRSIKTRYSTNNWEEMGKFVVEHNAPELYQKSLNQANMKQFLEDHPDLLPPGLNVDSAYVITVRRK